MIWATVKERGDVEIKDYVVFRKPQGQDNHLPPSNTWIMDFTMTHGIKESLLVCVDVCTRQYRCLSSIDSPFYPPVISRECREGRWEKLSTFHHL